MDNFMTNDVCHKKSDIKLFIITSDCIPLISTKDSDGVFMKNSYCLYYYSDDYQCKYHIDYLQVLLNKYFYNTSLKKYIGCIDNSKSEEIIKALVQENCVIFSNITLYDSINYQVHHELYGRLYLNTNFSSEQYDVLMKYSDIWQIFDYIDAFYYDGMNLIKTEPFYSKGLNNEFVKVKKK